MSANKLINYGFIPGISGAFLILISALMASRYNVLEKGWAFGGNRISFEKNESMFFVLLLTVFIMFMIEIFIRFYVEGKNIIVLSPKIKEKKYLDFFIECLLIYSANLFIFSLVYAFYKYAPEYGFKSNSEYYKPWFFVLEYLFNMYIIFSAVYIPITRMFQYDPDLEKKEMYHLLLLAVNKLLKPFKKGVFENLDGDYKNIVLGLMVKAFFVPLMTVYFFDNYSHLTNNFGYIANIIKDGFPGDYDLKKFSTDFYNINVSMIFAIDVGLAWGGYVISSRWICSNNVSVEPTMTGWLVALLCYPPYQIFPGIYFPFPGDKDFFTIPNEYVVFIFVLMSIFSFFIYMLATVFFGLRFSNLTHRGIIKVGLYRYIRHPAYASKNFSWWCILLPFIIYKFFGLKDYSAIFEIIGLFFLSYLYYWRALTEEKHLSADPEYIEYCKQVPYRFIPKVF